MSSNHIVVDKVLSDTAFCAKLVADPAQTLSAMGVDATPEVVAALKGLDPAALQRLAGAFGKQKVAS
jgi:hypothetical protein